MHVVFFHVCFITETRELCTTMLHHIICTTSILYIKSLHPAEQSGFSDWSPVIVHFPPNHFQGSIASMLFTFFFFCALHLLSESLTEADTAVSSPPPPPLKAVDIGETLKQHAI